jgi:hypothetical protein
LKTASVMDTVIHLRKAYLIDNAAKLMCERSNSMCFGPIAAHQRQFMISRTNNYKTDRSIHSSQSVRGFVVCDGLPW